MRIGGIAGSSSTNTGFQKVSAQDMIGVTWVTIGQIKDNDMSEDFNMSMRKFLKQVGVTSQQAIEDGLRKAGDTSGKRYEARVVLTIDGLDVDHVVTGTLEGTD